MSIRLQILLVVSIVANSQLLVSAEAAPEFTLDAVGDAPNGTPRRGFIGDCVRFLMK